LGENMKKRKRPSGKYERKTKKGRKRLKRTVKE
jgi:hypothetical protein